MSVANPTGRHDEQIKVKVAASPRDGNKVANSVCVLAFVQKSTSAKRQSSYSTPLVDGIPVPRGSVSTA